MKDLLKTIQNDRRREILRLVASHEMSVQEILGHFKVTRDAIAQDLMDLRKVGLLTARRDGRKSVYSIRLAGLACLEEFIYGLVGKAPVLFSKVARSVKTAYWVAKHKTWRDREDEYRLTSPEFPLPFRSFAAARREIATRKNDGAKCVIVFQQMVAR